MVKSFREFGRGAGHRIIRTPEDEPACRKE